MDNMKDENFVIYDVDENRTLGLYYSCDTEVSALADMQSELAFKKKYY